MMIELHSADGFDHDMLARAFNEAFSGYAVPFAFDGPGFAAFHAGRGWRPALSRVAVQDGRVAGFWHVGTWEERPGAGYLISAGTLPGFRGQSLGARIGEAVIADLARRGLATLQCECLRDNAPAFRLYTGLGFAVQRRLDCYTLAPPDTPPARAVAKAAGPVWLDPALFMDWEPSWQNGPEALRQLAPELVTWHIGPIGDPHGCLVLRPATKGVLQIAVRRDARRQGIARSLLTAAARETGPLRLVNVDAASAPFRALMTALGAEETEGQFEILRHLT